MNDDDGIFGVDWDDDGKVDTVDDMITASILDDENNNGGSGGSGGGCGTCLLWTALIPSGIIGLIIGIAKLV